MNYKLVDGKIYVEEKEFNRLKHMRGWSYHIDPFMKVRLVDQDNLWWAEIESIEPQELKDLIKSDLERMIDERKR